MNRYLGIDLGTSAAKALVLDESGRVLAKGSAGHPLAHPEVGWSEQSPGDWWQAVASASAQALARAGHSPLSGVAVSGQLNGLVLLDERYQPVADALIWLDQRAVSEAAELNARYPELLRAAVVNPASAIYAGTKLLWLHRHRPELLERARHLLLAKDYINLRLTGELAELLEAADVPLERLPPLHHSTDVIGRVTAAAAEATGIPRGTPVMAGAGDVTALSVGSGAIDEDVVSVTLGTAGHVVVASRNLTPAGYERIWQMRHAIPERYIRLGLVMSGGLSLAWFERELGAEERRQATVSGRDAYELLIERTASSEPGARGVLFLPFLEGAATPFQEPALRGAFLNVASSHVKGDLVQAVLEGVAYNVRDCVTLFEELGSDLREVRLSEGGSRSDTWCQVVADVLRKPVVTMHEIDASALGAAMIAMAGVSPEPDALRRVVSTVVRTQAGRHFTPRTEAANVYDRAYGRYRQAAARLLAWAREGKGPTG
ncbi:MAG: FGGY family carbohydrate kinase [Deinococcales bacterium]